VPNERDEHVDPQDQQGDAHHPAHELVEAGWQEVAEEDGHHSEGQNDRGVAERVESPVPDGPTAIVLGAGDVGDGRDVVPVDAVPQPEQQGPHQ
jgi:hypothetical protein